MSNFDDAINIVLKNEGIYSNDIYDHGGETKYGISKSSYPALDIKTLTLDQAKSIYRDDFWDMLNLSEVREQAIASKIFDLSVNIGKVGAAICVQRAARSLHANLKEDGMIGIETRSFLNSCDVGCFLCALRSEAAGYYRSLKNKIYEKGWLERAYQ